MNINWVELVKQSKDTATFEALISGEYEARVIDAQARLTQAGKHMYVVTYEVLGGPNKGRKVWHNVVLSPENVNALGFFFRTMAALGLSPQFFAGQPSDEDIVAALIDAAAHVELTLDQREWNGTIRNNVVAVRDLIDEDLDRWSDAAPAEEETEDDSEDDEDDEDDIESVTAVPQRKIRAKKSAPVEIQGAIFNGDDDSIPF